APTANKDVKGSLSLGVLVRGTGAQFRGIKGKGLIRAENTDIVEVPIGKAVYDGITIQQKPVFHSIIGDFSIIDGLVNFRKITLESESLTLKGDGWIGLDGQVYMTFLPRQKFNEIPLLGDIWTLAQDRLFDITVYGTIDNVKHKVNSPFSSKAQREIQVIAPMPPLELGERF
ncbi:MAG: hypothetical protein ACKVS6_10010, partial [Planctomycetota bacterium]